MAFPEDLLGLGLCLGDGVVVVFLGLELQQLGLQLVGPRFLEHLAVLFLEFLGGFFLGFCAKGVRLGRGRADDLLGLGLRLGEDLVHVLLDLRGYVFALLLAAEDLLDLQDGELLLQVGDELRETGVLLDLALQLRRDGLQV